MTSSRQRRRDRRTRDHHATRINNQAVTARDRATARWDQLRARIGRLRADGQQSTTRASRELQKQAWDTVSAAVAELTTTAAGRYQPAAGAAGSWARKLRGAATPADQAAVRWDQLRRYTAGLEPDDDLWCEVDATLAALLTVTERDFRGGSNSEASKTGGGGGPHRRRAPARRVARARMQRIPNSGHQLRTVMNLTRWEGWL